MIYSSLIGNPVDHSVSPILFNYLAECANLEYAHIKINVPTSKNLNDTLDSLKMLGFCGANVTLPYKIDIIKYLDQISPAAKKIGAVNTLVLKHGKVIGYNTDAYGAQMAIESKLKKIGPDDKILILGAGGAARAIIYAMYQKTKNILILNRDLTEAKFVAKDISGDKIIYKKLTNSNIKGGLSAANVIINATPVGMSPRDNDEIIGKNLLKEVNVSNKYFFDAVFNPYRTVFLKTAANHGARVCSGTYMMIYQAIAAFNLWTGRRLAELDIEKINKLLIKTLKH